MTEPNEDTVGSAGSGMCELTNQSRFCIWEEALKRQVLNRAFQTEG